MTKSRLDRIKDYYDLEEISGERLRISNDGKKVILQKTEKIYSFSFGNVINENEYEKYIKNGKIVKITGIELYSDYFDWDEERHSVELNGFGLRTMNYLDKIKENSGFVKEENGYDEESFDKSYRVNHWGNASEIEIGKVKNGLWCAQFGWQTDIDDYNISRLYFSKKPNIYSIQTITDLINLKFNFRFKKEKEMFKCWECGRETHWLDCPGSFSDKLESLLESYCGC